MLQSSIAAFGIVILTSSASCALNPESLNDFNAAPGFLALESLRRFTARQIKTGANSQLNPPTTSLRSERLAADPLLDGYLFIDIFSDDQCSTYLQGTSTKLNTCISTVCTTTEENGCFYDKFKAHFIVTATSTSATIAYYNDFKCTEKNPFSPDETTGYSKDCSSRSKQYVTASYLLSYPVSYVEERQENCDYLRSI